MSAENFNWINFCLRCQWTDDVHSLPSCPCFAGELFDVQLWRHCISLHLYRNPDAVAYQVELKFLGAAVEVVKH